MSERDDRRGRERKGRGEPRAGTPPLRAAAGAKPREQRTAARLVKPRVRARLRDSVSALADALAPDDKRRARDVRAGADTEPAAGVAAGEVLVLVADAHRVLGVRLAGGGARLPAGFDAAELELLVGRLRASFAAASREAAPTVAVAERDLPEADAAALVRGGFDLRPLSPDEDPVARTAAEYAALLEESLPTVEVARRLGVEDSRVRQRLAGPHPTLYGWKLSGSWRVPRFQFDPAHAEQLVPGLALVVPRLDRSLHPVAVARWFVAPSVDLPRPGDEERALSPREWLLAGYPPAAVADLAATLAPQ